MKITSHGFSLLELLITLTLITITAAFTFPSLHAIWQKSTATTLLNELEHAIDIARTTAIARGRTTRLCASADAKICGDNWQAGFIVSVDEDVIFVFQNFSAHGILHWRGFQKKPARIDFSPDAQMIWQNGTFWYCATSSSNPNWALAMNKIGRVREMRADKWGKIFDDHGKLLGC